MLNSDGLMRHAVVEVGQVSVFGDVFHVLVWFSQCANACADVHSVGFPPSIHIWH